VGVITGKESYLFFGIILVLKDGEDKARKILLPGEFFSQLPSKSYHQGTSEILCLSRVDHHEFTKRSLNMMANCVFASDHSRGGRFHSAAARLRQRYSNFVAASSVGK